LALNKTDMQDSIEQLQENIDSVQMKMDSLLNYFSGMNLSTTNGDDLSNYEFIALVLDTVIWPLVLLFILVSFKREFGGIFDRLKTFKVTPSGIEIESFEETFEKIKKLSSSVGSITGKSKSMASPPDPLNPTDPKMIIAKVQVDLDKNIRKMAKENEIEFKDVSSPKLNYLLKTKGVISSEQSDIIAGLMKLSEDVMSGQKVTKEQAASILDIYGKLS
jgi:hypothetical protein